MKKIGIITFHFVNNYGGVLQTFALQSAIKKMGYEVKIIDYRNWFIRFTDAVRILPITKRIDVFSSGIGTMKARISRIHKIQSFINNKLSLTNRVHRANISTRVGNFDKYICGSDQIWNPILTGGVDSPYFLGFVQDDSKKIAYAPSMGTGRIPQFMLKYMFRQISKISFLSIRERDTEKLIEKNIDRKVELMVDPTLLIDSDEWRNLCIYNDELPEKYILLYMMQGDEHIYKFARAMKEKYKLPIVEISRYGYNPGFADHVLVDVGIEEFLGLFDRAAYVCTNSYHGFVYSMIFEKELCLIPSVHFSARIKNLLELLGMNNDDLSTIDNLLVKFDYDKINAILALYRKKADVFLKSAIES